MKTYKGFPICDKHGITYKFRNGCLKCKKANVKKGRKELDIVLEKIGKEFGLTQDVDDKDRNNNI